MACFASSPSWIQGRVGVSPVMQISASFLSVHCLTGKSSVGKSSTVNSLLGETAARVQAFKLQADAEIISPFVKEVRWDEPVQLVVRVELRLCASGMSWDTSCWTEFIMTS